MRHFRYVVLTSLIVGLVGFLLVVRCTNADAKKDSVAEFTDQNKSVRCKGWSDRVLEELVEHSATVETITIQSGEFPNDALESELKFPALKALTISGVESIPSRIIKDVAARGSINSLELNYANISEGVGSIANIDDLKLGSLLFVGVREIKVGELEKFSNMKSLNHVSIDNLETVSPLLIDELGKITSAHSFAFVSCNLTNVKKTQWEQIGHATNMNFSLSEGIVTNYLSAGIAQDTLVELNLSGIENDQYVEVASKSEALFINIANYKKLRTLSVGSIAINSKCIDKISELTNLQILSIGLSGATDEVISKLIEVKIAERLESIALYGCDKIGDKSIGELLKASAFIGIDLTGTSITDKTLESLSDEPQLEWISIGYCPSITKAGLKNYIEAHPKVEVIH